ncbi:MAG: hypothetical protein ACRDPY_44190 [Streptosporangiaceae bacterium]
MAAQTREQGRYLGGRPPYGYRLTDVGPYPKKAHAAWGRRAHGPETDPATSPLVTWMFAQRLAGHSTTHHPGPTPGRCRAPRLSGECGGVVGGELLEGAGGPAE